jgi:hypothetical protein
MAVLYENLNDIPKARECANIALAIFTAALGDKHPSTARARKVVQRLR